VGHQLGKIVGILVHVVPMPGLAGTSVAPAVVRDDAIAALSQEQHLRIPCIGA